MRKRDENGQHPLFHIPVASSHQQIDVVADGTLQVISGDSITRLQVTDNGFNRRTLPALFPLLVLLVPCILLNGWKMIPQILARVSLMQASTMDHLDKLHQQICSKQIRLMNRTAMS